MTPPSDDEQLYQQLAAEIRGFAESLAEPLRGVCAPFVETLLGGEFARIVALLPTWLRDLLPVTAAAAQRLGVAQLFGWWYGAARDAALDGAASPAVNLGGTLALLRALAIYGDLGAAALPAWPQLEALEQRSALAHARELASRPGTGPITRAHVAVWGLELVGERAAGLRFAAYVQMDLAGLAPDDPRRGAVEEALGCLVAARQLGDDAGDWRDDLRAGQLNLVSAGLARQLLADAASASVSADQLAGRHISAEHFWAELWATHANLCAQGQTALAPFGPTRLAALLAAEAERGTHGARLAATWRAGVREALGIACLAKS
jgi:hypothetical protein